MKKKKILVIGIDGMDPVVVSRFRNELPNIQKLLSITGDVHYESVFPPDSVPAWISFYTGKNPAEHGILEYVDYLSPAHASGVNVERFRGRTFWDVISRSGKRVAILNPFLAYPPWEVNGVMASGPAFVAGKKMVFPEEFVDRHVIPFLGGYSGLPGERELAQFLDKAEEETHELVKYTQYVWNEVAPDLLFVSFFVLDRIQHFMWRYCDKEDPTYPGETPFSGALLRFYKLIDESIGFLREVVGSDVQTLVMSDHGHGRRCTHLINLNEILRREKLLECRGASSPFSRERMLEKLKNTVIHYAHRWHLERLLQKATKWIPNKKKLKRGDHIIDKEKSFAYVSDFDGANPYGGICLTRTWEDHDEYEKLREQVIKLLLNVHQLAALPKSVVKWARRREEVYTGPYLERYPDVLFELDTQYGVNWSVFTPLVVSNPRHRTLSGGHLKPGVLLVSNDEMLHSLHEVESPITLFNHILEWMDLSEGLQKRNR